MQDGAYLGVEQSATGRRWIGPGPDIERLAIGLSQATGLPDIVARLLAQNQVPPTQAAAYLAPKLRDLLPDPNTLMAMEPTAKRLLGAVQDRQRIAVFADYDVDGACSAALLAGWLRALDRDVTVYIPDRIDEGYGPNAPAMAQLGGSHDLIICVDCGTVSVEPITAARQAGAEVLVADHHLPGITLPEALVVNPNRADDRSGLGHLCAAGVVFLLLVAANRALRQAGAFTTIKEPDLMAMLDLVALATVADVAPMIGLNRAFVRQGLAVMARRSRPGLVALADRAGLTAPPTARDLGWALGPRINAGGRIGAADLGARLLMTSDSGEATALADRLDRLNTERRGIEAAVLDQATQQIESRGPDAPLAWAAAEGWHPGVVGIVAGRLKERFNRPAVVIGIAAGEGKGSGRSVQGIDLGGVVAGLAADGVLLKGGGHKMAAGLTVAADQIQAAMQALSDRVAAQGQTPQGPQDLVVLGATASGGATPDLVEQIEAAGPFGPANPAPRIAMADVIPSSVRMVGQGHAQVRLTSQGLPGVAGIAFRASENGLAAFLEDAAGAQRRIHVAGRLELDDWGGRRKAKLRIDDAAAADERVDRET